MSRGSHCGNWGDFWRLSWTSTPGPGPIGGWVFPWHTQVVLIPLKRGGGTAYGANTEQGQRLRWTSQLSRLHEKQRSEESTIALKKQKSVNPLVSHGGNALPASSSEKSLSPEEQPPGLLDRLLFSSNLWAAWMATSDKRSPVGESGNRAPHHCCQLKSSLLPKTKKNPRIVAKMTVLPVRTRAQAPHSIRRALANTMGSPKAETTMPVVRNMASSLQALLMASVSSTNLLAMQYGMGERT